MNRMPFGIPKSESREKDSLTYGGYLKIPEIISLQRLLSDPPAHDEMLFIVIHQIYELWFKEILHELDAVIGFLNRDASLDAHRLLRRCIEIGRVLVAQIAVLETMTPVDFLDFRDKLMPASGFQSAQFREIEFRCGLPMPESAVRHLDITAEERARLARRLQEPTLYDALKGHLTRAGFAAASHDELLATFRTIYENEESHYALYLLLEDVIEFDERVLLWRGRHVRMVERMIGMKMGTGGSLGAAYLQKTLERRFFPELWEVRTLLGGSATS